MPITKRRSVSLAFVAAGALFAGCGETSGVSSGTNQPASGESLAAFPAGKEHDHSGWWCTEHGVPEDQCGRCSTKLTSQFKREGDWCQKHDRPESQCFICHPEYEGKFVALYEAKFGKKPPERPSESDE
ncbi:MAG: RND transporter [Planctomycetaceae bacterium]